MNYPANIKILVLFGLLISFSISDAKSIKDNPQFGQCLVKTNNESSKVLLISENPFLDAIYLEADEGSIKKQGVSTLLGNVIIQQNNTVFNANRAQINRHNNQVKAQGSVTLSDSNFILKSPSIEYNLNDKTGIIDQADYSLGNQGVHGKSSQIKQLDNHRLILNDATFSSCPASQDSWHLASSEIKLNNKTQIGTAKGVTFNVGKVPVFYFPWLKFPINNQRLSGFLTPSIRLQSNAGISLPYYLNFAPNYDATVRLTTLQNRGYQMDSEFRYLTEQHKGILEYDFIPKDKSFNDEKRDYFKIDHHTKINSKTQLSLKAEGVSDADFFDDFSNSLETSTRPALQRRLEIVKVDRPWTVSAAVEDFQVIDTNDNPYAKLPEFKLGYSPKSSPKELKLKVDSEIIYFDKKNDVTGARADIKLQLSKKWGEDAWYLKPSLSLQHTLYSLDNNNGNSSLNRTTPYYNAG